MTAHSTAGFEKIVTLENLIEAQVLESFLKDEGIPHRMQSFHDTAYDGLFQFQRGWGAVYALPRHGDAIRELLEQIRRERDDEDPSGTAE